MNRETLLKRTDTVKHAVEIIEEKKVRAVLIVDDEEKLLGIFTEGDLRRYILKNGKMNDSLAKAMNRSPKVFTNMEEAQKESIVAPIIDKKRKLIDVLNNNEKAREVLLNHKCLKNVPLVIMAGGIGTRLQPLTKILPKALIPIGEETIIERIIDNFIYWGCEEVYIIINYKGNMIKAYFKDRRTKYKLHFVQEEKFLGTGGGLFLLRNMINSTFILSNCDILVDTDYECLLKTHRMKSNDITFVSAYKNIQIPYGVIQTDVEGNIIELNEKPEFSFLTNVGMYVLEPEIIKNMSQNIFCHITDLAMNYKHQGKKVGVFPISNNAWQDMGQIDEMKNMIKTFEK